MSNVSPPAKPPVEGDPPADPPAQIDLTEGVTDETVVKLDGQELTVKEVREKLANEQKLLGNQTKAQQDAARERQDLSRQVAELRGRLEESSKHAQQQQAEPEFDFQQELNKLDPLVEDHPQQLAALYQRAREHDKSALEATVDDRLKKQEETLSSQQKFNQINSRIDQTHAETIGVVAQRLGVELTPAQRDEVDKALRATVGPSEQDATGFTDGTTRRYVATEKGIERAFWASDSVRAALLASETSKARDDGIRGRALGERATQSGPSPGQRGAPPSADASDEDLNTYLRGLPEAEAVSWMNKSPENMKRIRDMWTKREEILKEHPGTLA